MGKLLLTEQELINLVKKIIKEDSDRSEVFDDYADAINAIESAFQRGEYEGIPELFEDEVKDLMEQIYEDESLSDEEVDHLLFMVEDLYNLPNQN